MNRPRRPFSSGDLGDGDEQENDAGEDPEGNQDLTHHTTIHGKWGKDGGLARLYGADGSGLLTRNVHPYLLRSAKPPVFVKAGAYTSRLLRRHRFSHFFLRFSNFRLMSDWALRKRSLALACTSRMWTSIPRFCSA